MEYERDTEYRPDDALAPEERAYGDVADSTTRNIAVEERETAQSEGTGRVPRREVEELLADAGNVDQVKGTRYKGKGNDAYKQERQLDQTLSKEGAI